jgi:hypothetical protein
MSVYKRWIVFGESFLVAAGTTALNSEAIRLSLPSYHAKRG